MLRSSVELEVGQTCEGVRDNEHPTAAWLFAAGRRALLKLPVRVASLVLLLLAAALGTEISRYGTSMSPRCMSSQEKTTSAVAVLSWTAMTESLPLESIR